MSALFDNPPVRVRSCRHGTMMYLTNDLIGRSLDLYGEFAEQEMQIFDAFVTAGAVVVDVGANVGTHTLRLAQLAGSSGRVLAFEPQRTIYHLLCGTLALNRTKTVRAYHAAVGAAPGSLEVPPIDYSQAGQFNFGAVPLGGEATYPAGGETVPVVTLDSFGLERCDLIKVDVEGMERAVLEGAAQTIARTQPVLYVENNRRDKSPALLRWMLDAGYRCYWHIIDYYSPANFRESAEDIFAGAREINVLAVPADRGADVGGLREATTAESWSEEIFVAPPG